MMKMKMVENQLTITATTLANFTRPVLLALSVRYYGINEKHVHCLGNGVWPTSPHGPFATQFNCPPCDSTQVLLTTTVIRQFTINPFSTETLSL
jgi:hypothetical protein